MKNDLDELTKGLAQSVTRRHALKKFAAGIGGMALACFGLTRQAQANERRTCGGDGNCGNGGACPKGTHCMGVAPYFCYCG